MKKVVSFNLQNQGEWEFIQNLLNRLHIAYETLDGKSSTDQVGAEQEADLIREIYGSWPGDESSDEKGLDRYYTNILGLNNPKNY